MRHDIMISKYKDISCILTRRVLSRFSFLKSVSVPTTVPHLVVPALCVRLQCAAGMLHPAYCAMRKLAGYARRYFVGSPRRKSAPLAPQHYTSTWGRGCPCMLGGGFQTQEQAWSYAHMDVYGPVFGPARILAQRCRIGNRLYTHTEIVNLVTITQ